MVPREGYKTLPEVTVELDLSLLDSRYIITSNPSHLQPKCVTSVRYADNLDITTRVPC